MDEKKDTRKPGGRILLAAGITVLILLAGALAFGSYQASQSGRILPRTQISGVDVGGMTPADAKALLEQRLGGVYRGNSLVLALPDGAQLAISADEARAGADIDAAVDAAWRRGHSNPLLDGAAWLYSQIFTTRLDAAYTLGNPEYVREIVDEAVLAGARTLREHEYHMTDEGIEIIKGTAGRAPDAQALYQQVTAALEAANFTEIDAAPVLEEPQEINFAAVRETVFVEPADAYFDQTAKEIVPHVTGIDLDIPGAHTRLDNAEEGDSFRILFLRNEPEITTERLKDTLFRDLLGSCTTTVSGTQNRLSNVALAASAVHDTIYMPGEVFSYNGVVGSRSAERGYLLAPAYRGGETVDEIGGGICQVSSSVYLAALRANLKIVERYAHMYAVGYLPDGMDATVYYGSLDFCFENDTNAPIRVVATVVNRKLTIQIFGTNESGRWAKAENVYLAREPYQTVYKASESVPPGQQVVDVTPYAGLRVQVYRCVYDKDDNLISRTLESTNRYLKRDQVILVHPDDPLVNPNPPPAAPEPEPPEPPGENPAGPSEPSDPPGENPAETPAVPEEPAAFIPSDE